jgi:hypothetical protein
MEEGREEKGREVEGRKRKVGRKRERESANCPFLKG